MNIKTWLQLPVEFRPSWRHPPVAALTLALTLLIVYIWQTKNDQLVFTEGIAAYHQTGLFRLELKAYTAYVDSQHSLYGNRRLEDKYRRILQATSQDLSGDLIVQDMLDAPDFVAYMQREGHDMMSPADFATWQDKRRQPDEIIKQLSHHLLGLSGPSLSPAKLLSCHFYNPALWTALLMSLGILLAGYATERHLGSSLFAVLVLSISFLGAAAVSLFMAAEDTFGGALLLFSVVAGVQLGCFWNRITGFLATVCWLGALMYQDVLTGGTFARPDVIVTTSAVLFLLAFNTVQIYTRLRQKEHDRITRLPRHKNALMDPALWPESFRHSYAEALDHLAKMEFDKARAVLNELLHKFPGNSLVLESLFNLYKYHPDSALRLHWARHAISQALATQQPAKAYQFWLDFVRYGGALEELEPDIHILLVVSALRKDLVTAAEEVCRHLIAANSPAALLKEVLPPLIHTLQTQERTLKLADYQRTLASLA